MNRQEMMQHLDPTDEVEREWYQTVLDRLELEEARELMVVPLLQQAAGHYSLAVQSAEGVREAEPESNEEHIYYEDMLWLRVRYHSVLETLDPEDRIDFPDAPGEELV